MSLSNFETMLKGLKAFPLLGSSISYNDYIALDLSDKNQKLKIVDVSLSVALKKFIWDYVEKNNKKVAYGGYLEKRNIYNRSSYFNQNNSTTERNIHLGLDLWIEADSPVFAPLDGVVHSFKNNQNFGDYGPTIILEHHIENEKFYILYGHLSLDSIEKLKVGAEVKSGEKIATLGTSDVNGDYAPHLHFQIIRDIQGFKGDYPGVCSDKDLEFYKINCPDPDLLLKLI